MSSGQWSDVYTLLPSGLTDGDLAILLDKVGGHRKGRPPLPSPFLGAFQGISATLHHSPQVNISTPMLNIHTSVHTPQVPGLHTDPADFSAVVSSALASVGIPLPGGASMAAAVGGEAGLGAGTAAKGSKGAVATLASSGSVAVIVLQVRKEGAPREGHYTRCMHSTIALPLQHL